MESAQLTLTWGSWSHQGQVRRTNEDNALAGQGVFVVADGMGGHVAGEVASALAVAGFARLQTVQLRTAQDVLAALDAAHRSIVDDARRHSHREGMGTTVAAVVAVDNGGHPDALAVNVGDSRIYRLRAQVLDQISIDHSEAQELIDQGTLSAEAAATHPSRHIVTRIVGGPSSPIPDVWYLAPQDGDRYMLCTDGLLEALPLAAVADVAVRESAPQVLAKDLVTMAVEGGARDDVTVVVVDVRCSVMPVGMAPLDQDVTAPRGPEPAPSADRLAVPGSGHGARR